MKIILPLYVEFKQPKNKKDIHMSYSLNSFLMPLCKKPKRASPFYPKRAKEELQSQVEKQLRTMDRLSAPWPKKVVVTIYRPNDRHRDMDNFSILVKFAMDVVKISHIPEDDFRYIDSVLIQDGGLNKKMPHATLEILDHEIVE